MIDCFSMNMIIYFLLNYMYIYLSLSNLVVDVENLFYFSTFEP